MNFKQLPKLSKGDFLGISGTLLVFLIIIFFNISPIALNQYLFICGPDAGSISSHNSCMDPYWSQYSIDKAAIILLLATLVITSIYYLLGKTKSNN